MSVRLLAATSVLCLAASVSHAATAPTTAPAQLSPRGTITQPRPFYQWRPVATATDYAFTVNGPAGSPVVQTSLAAGSICDTNVCTARPAVDLALGAHQWRVQASNSGGSGPASPLLAFTVAAGTATPTPTVRPTASPTARPTPAGTTYVTTLTPENNAMTNATGTSTLILAADERSARISLSFSGLTSAQTASHIHGPADPPQTAPALFSIPMGNFNDVVWTFQASGNVTVQQQVDAIKSGRIYINVHSEQYPSGEIRGHYRPAVLPTPTPTTGPTATPTPPTGAPSAAEAVRFLQQASWGANAASINRVRQLGYAGWIDEQLSLPQSRYLDAILAAPTTDDEDRSRAFQARFFRHALTGEDQLRQRVGWALSQIFVVSDLTIDDGPAMASYVDMLNRHASGNYRQLLIELTLNPVMGDYLDMVNNVKPNPQRGRIANENYAREILQLFSIGLFRLNPNGTLVLDGQGKPIPTYDQTAIEGLARVFTGWTYAPLPGQPNNPRNPRNYLAPMVLHQRNHDVGAKTILNGVVLPAGRDGNTDLNQALLVIVQHPNVGPFIGRQLIQHLVTSNPSPAYVARITNVFNNNGTGVRGDLRAVVKAILLDPEARGNTPPPAGKLKEPVLAMLQLLRALNGVGDGLGLAGIARNMGQDPFRSPTVFNYYQPDFQLPGTTLTAPPFQIFSEATVVHRSNWVNTVIFNRVNVPFGPAGTSVAVDLAPWDVHAANPAALVNQLDTLLMAGQMSPGMRSRLVTDIGRISSSRLRQRAQNALYLVATSAQFNVGR